MAFDLNEKPIWVPLAIGLALGVAMFWATNQYIFKEIRKEIAKIEDNIDGLQREIDKGLQAKRDLPRLEEDIRNYELELERLRKILPTRRETDLLIKKLKQLTERSNFRLTRFNPQAPVDRDFIQEWPINVELDGTYHELGLFFDRLGRFPRIINVTQLRLSPLRAGADYTIHAAFTQVTFIYREEAGGGSP